MMNAGAVGHLWLCLKDQAMSELVCGVNVQKYFRNVLVCVCVSVFRIKLATLEFWGGKDVRLIKLASIRYPVTFLTTKLGTKRPSIPKKIIMYLLSCTSNRSDMKSTGQAKIACINTNVIRLQFPFVHPFRDVTGYIDTSCSKWTDINSRRTVRFRCSSKVKPF